MSTHDMNIANQGFPAFRSDLNNALAALVSNSSSATEPTTTFAYQFWADTANDLLKQRNAANDGWVSILTLSTGAPVGITTDKISEGNSSVEVVDSGSGYITIVVDGTETARITPGSFTIKDSSGTSRGYIVGDSDGLLIASDGTNNITFDVNGVERARLDSSGNLKFNSGYGSVATAYGCRAWVNFNSVGTVSITGSGNVSSITDLGVGDFRINLTNAMPDTNYSAVGMGGNYGVTNGYVSQPSHTSTSVFSFRNVNAAGSANIDCPIIHVAFFR